MNHPDTRDLGERAADRALGRDWPDKQAESCPGILPRETGQDPETLLLLEARAEIRRLRDVVAKLDFACNTLRLDLGIAPDISNTDTPRIVAAFQDALAAERKARSDAVP